MKRILKYLAIILLSSFVISYMLNFFTPKPFKFEDFKTREEAQAYFDEHYPIGSDVDILFDDLKKVGVLYIDAVGTNEKETKVTKTYYKMRLGKDDLNNYNNHYVSKYINNWISRDPRGFYILGIFTFNGNITNVLIDKWYKF